MSATRPLRIGLTGGIASGKSMVASLFENLGVPVIDTDRIARELVEPGEAALEEIRQAFGSDIIGADGRLDRRRLRSVVFSDPEQKQELEAILHPRIREDVLRRSASAEGPYQVIVVPLLVGSPLKDFMDRVLVVDCSEQTQVERLRRRDAESDEQARRMMAAQASRQQRLAIADDIVDNDGSRRKTEEQVAKLHQCYRDLASQSRT